MKEWWKQGAGVGKDPARSCRDRGSGIEFKLRSFPLGQRNWPRGTLRTLPTWVSTPGSEDGYSKGLGLKTEMQRLEVVGHRE